MNLNRAMFLFWLLASILWVCQVAWWYDVGCIRSDVMGSWEPVLWDLCSDPSSRARGFFAKYQYTVPIAVGPPLFVILTGAAILRFFKRFRGRR